MKPCCTHLKRLALPYGIHKRIARVHFGCNFAGLSRWLRWRNNRHFRHGHGWWWRWRRWRSRRRWWRWWGRLYSNAISFKNWNTFSIITYRCCGRTDRWWWRWRWSRIDGWRSAGWRWRACCSRCRRWQWWRRLSHRWRRRCRSLVAILWLRRKIQFSVNWNTNVVSVSECHIHDEDDDDSAPVAAYAALALWAIQSPPAWPRPAHYCSV